MKFKKIKVELYAVLSLLRGCLDLFGFFFLVE